MAITGARITKDDRRKWDALATKLQEVKKTSGASAKIGVFANQGSDLVKIASANEFGATIKRKGTSGGVNFGFRTQKDLRANRVRFLRSGKGVVALGTTKASNKAFTIKIPERSFLRAAIDENRQRILRFIDQQGINLVVKGQSIKKTLNLLGLFGVSLVKQKMIKGPFVPNAPATIRKKKSSKPLIDKGRLFGAITHKT